MNESKMIYIDLYRPIFIHAGLSIKEVKHLKKSIYTQTSVYKKSFLH